MKHAGFSLLEVLLATIIASMLGMVLFQSFNQAAKTLASTNGTATTYINLLTCYARMSADIQGAFIPAYTKAQEATPASTPQQQNKTKIEKESPQKSGLQDPYVYKEDGGKLKLFSFITRNPILAYKQPNIRIVRVTYTLKSDPENPSEFMLLRAQTNKLKFDEQKTGIPYVLLRHIKSFTCTLRAPDIKKMRELAKQKEEAKKQQDQDASNKPKEQKQKTPFKLPPMVTYHEWPPEKSTKKNEQPFGLPPFVKVSLVYHDQYRDHDTDFSFTVVSMPEISKEQKKVMPITLGQAQNPAQQASQPTQQQAPTAPPAGQWSERRKTVGS